MVRLKPVTTEEIRTITERVEDVAAEANRLTARFTSGNWDNPPEGLAEAVLSLSNSIIALSTLSHQMIARIAIAQRGITLTHIER